MSVKVIDHIYYDADDLPKTRSPTQPTRRRPEEGSSRGLRFIFGCTQWLRKGGVWTTDAVVNAVSSESPKTRRYRQRVSMRKDVFGERVIPTPKSELKEMVYAIGSPGIASEEQEKVDPSREPPARTLTRSVTEVLRNLCTSTNVLQVALAYLPGAKPEIHTQLV